jgi:hypothetical protein
VFVGDPGNAPDTASNCFAAELRLRGYSYFLSKYEVTNAQYAEFLNAKAAERPARALQPGNGRAAAGRHHAQREIRELHVHGEAGLREQAGELRVVLRRAALHELAEQRAGRRRHGDGRVHAARRDGDPSNGTTVLRNPGANIFLPSENEWYKAAYYDPGTRQSYFDYPAGSNTQTVCAAPGATPNTANCGERRRQRDRRGRLHGLGEPERDVRPGRERVGVERGDRVWLAPGPPGRELGLRRRRASPRRGRGRADPPSRADIIGFRVASLVPEPGTALLLMSGLAGLAARQESRKRNL